MARELTLRQRRHLSVTNRRWWTKKRRTAQSNRMKEMIGSGRRLPPPRGNWRHDAWTPEQDAALQHLSGLGRPVHEMIVAVNAVPFGPPRTFNGVEWRLKHLGLPQAGWGWTGEALRRLFSVQPKTITRWLADGLLGGTRTGQGFAMRGVPWVVSEAELDHFLRTERWRYDWRKITIPAVRSRAETYDRRDPWIPLLQAAEILGIARRQLYVEPWLSRFDWRKREVKPAVAGSCSRVYLRSELLAYLVTPDPRSEEMKRRFAIYKGKPRGGRRPLIAPLATERVA